ncbi:hypothetical protein HK405_015093, partial [Cladochytrium tenue]
VVAEFQPGSFFGEVGLFFRITRTATVRAASTLILFKLAAEDLHALLQTRPDINSRIQEEARLRFEYNQLRSKAMLSNTQEVATEMEVVRETLKTIPLFKTASNAFFDELALKLKLKIYQPNDLIIQKGERGGSMFFVMDGTASVESEDGRTKYGELRPFAFFGEVALFYEVNRTATVRARTVCTCFELMKDVLQSVLKHHPVLADTMREKAAQNYNLFLARQAALHDAPAHVRLSFAEEATIEKLKQVPTFRGCSHAFLQSLASLTTVRSFKDHDVVVKNGDPSKEMFFVLDGAVEVVSPDGATVFDRLDNGQFFGEVGLIKGMVRSASVRVASPTCIVIEVSKAAVLSVLKEYPGAYETIALEAEKRYAAILGRLADRPVTAAAAVSEASTYGPGGGGGDVSPDNVSVATVVPDDTATSPDSPANGLRRLFSVRRSHSDDGTQQPSASGAVSAASAGKADRRSIALGDIFRRRKNSKETAALQNEAAESALVGSGRERAQSVGQVLEAAKASSAK